MIIERELLTQIGQNTFDREQIQPVREEIIKKIPEAVEKMRDAIVLCYSLGLTAGWWHDKTTKEPNPNREFGQLCALFHSEISEAFEAYRTDSADDKLPQYSGQIVEMNDLVIRVFDWAAQDEERLNQFIEAFIAKLIFNTIRKDHTLEARAAAGGKKI